MKRYNLLIAISITMLVLSTCRPKSDASNMAMVVIQELSEGSWTAFLFQLVPLDQGNKFQMDATQYPHGTGTVSVSVPAGKYKVILEYFQGSTMVYSAHACTGQTPPNEERDFVAGLNQLQIQVCPENNSPSGKAAGTFYVMNGRLYDKTGAEFLIRGVNDTFAYFLKEATTALDRIKELGFNTVRIVWCADTLLRTDRCDKNAIHSAQELAGIIDKMRSLQLVGVLEMQNTTGSDDPANLRLMADYYLKPEIKDILLKNKDILIINIANEWFTPWQDPTGVYLSTYKEVITRLRGGGLPHLLVVDGGGWAQDFGSIQRNYQQLMAMDSNLMFSTHMYDIFGTAQTVSDAFQFVRNNHVPWMIGEFGCSHSGKQVACETIFSEANSPQGAYGYIAWSFAGNNSDESGLNITTDWKNLSSPWGNRLVTGAGGISSTAKPACLFNSQGCP